MHEVLRDSDEARRELERRMQCVPRILRARNEELGRPLPSDELADLAQDALAVIWRKLPEYEGRASLETWMYRICSLEHLSAARRARRRDRLGRAEGDAGPLDDVAAKGDDLPSRLRFEELYHHLDRLPNDLRRVLRAKHYESKTFEEIGRELGLRPSGAKHHYYRALEMLRERMGGEEGQP